MRKWFILLMLYNTIGNPSVSCFAQSTLDRRIYLWDVTLSMKGKGTQPTPDIYNNVVEFLVRDINSLTDPSTEIIVLPFQTSVLENWQVKATEDGKKEIVSKIRKYANNQLTNTNIAGPIAYAKSHYIGTDRRNMLILLTDGAQSPQFGGNDELLKSIKGWRDYAQMKNAYLVYVMLTDAAVNDDIRKEADVQARVSVVTPPLSMEFVELSPIVCSFNIKDDKTIDIPLVCNKNIAIPNGVKVSVKSCEDSPIAIDTTTEITDGRLSFMPQYAYNTLKTQIPDIGHMTLNLEVLNGDEIKANTNKIILFSPASIQVKLINKREKTLTIKIK